MEFCIEIGGIAVKLNHRYDYVRRVCEEYVTDKVPAFSVSVTDAQIEGEQRLMGRYPKAVCEGTCLHREVVKGLVSRGLILIHAAVVAVDGEAYVFMAKSGVGKSTHVRLWCRQFGERAMVVNGDKPMFSFVGDTLWVHGTPWKGKEGWGRKLSLPVKAFCFLERGMTNEIVPASESEVVGRIFHQVLLPQGARDMGVFMNLLERAVKTVPFYLLRCNMEQEAALVAYQGMRKDKT